MIISLATAKAYLGVTVEDDDDAITNEIEISQGIVEAYCDRKFEEQDIEESVLVKLNGNNLILRNYPINSISSIESESSGNLPDYYLSKANGVLEGRFCKDRYIVNYNFGYSEENIPSVLKIIILEIIKRRYLRYKNNEELESDDIKRVSITGVMTVEYNKKLGDGSPLSELIEGFGSSLDEFKSIGVY